VQSLHPLKAWGTEAITVTYILIIDDDPALRAVVDSNLTNHGHRVATAESPRVWWRLSIHGG
jgi:CheY-like chemotaxis protein